ncbi:MAG: hypothetical protein QOI81_2016 [Actinomycetota bacterium]|nr:hypothetical protein [Actinomycetota bacterium]
MPKPREPDEVNGKPKRGWALAIALGLIIGGLFGGTAAALLWHHSHEAALPSACAAIGCSDLGTGMSPGLTLTDQSGKAVSLSSLRGKVVVLAFMDPVCVDICPLVSDEFLRAQRILGSAAANVEFVGVNVNQFQESQAAVESFSVKHRLNTMANWHFLTGSTDQLRQVWSAYHVAVLPNPTGDVAHTSVLYLIDPDGHLRVEAFPVKSKASVITWAHSIASLVTWLYSN